MFTYNQGL